MPTNIVLVQMYGFNQYILVMNEFGGYEVTVKVIAAIVSACRFVVSSDTD